MPYFGYGETEMQHLRARDPVLAAAMDAIGHIHREVMPDLFCALVYQIISQQISRKAVATIWGRLLDATGEITPERVCAADMHIIQQCGTSMRKAAYIKELAQAVMDGTLDLDALHSLPDDAVCARLSAIKGIGVWTVQMLMTFSMQRPNIISWGDLGIHRGLRMLYRHRKITKALFEKYRRRYAPYASVASLYLWEISSGGCAGLTDPAPLTEAQRARRAHAKQKAAAKPPAAT